MNCETCEKLTKWFLYKNPERNGRVICEKCLDVFKTLQGFVFIDLPYDPYERKETK